MQVYYATYERDNGEFPLVTNHDTLEEVEAYCEAHGLTYYEMIGNTVDSFERCPICGEWVESIGFTVDGICEDCERRGREHGF